MRLLSFVLAFTLVSITFATNSPSKSPQKKTTQEKLIAVAANIQNHEAHLSAVEQDLIQTREAENALLVELGTHHQQLMETIHYLRHAVQCSPLLAMLSVPKPEDVIHSLMLLQSITPEIHARNQQMLEKVKTLSTLRAQLETKQNQLRDLTFQYHQEHDNLNVLLNTPPGTSTPIENPEKNTGMLTLLPPVVGKIIPTYGSSNPEWASYVQGILFITRSGAQVISPLSGKIAFAGDYAAGQEKMVIVQNANSHIVISGLGSLNCKIGQDIRAGEPVGRMPIKASRKSKDSPTQTEKLYLEAWHQEQTIDPQSVLKERK